MLRIHSTSQCSNAINKHFTLYKRKNVISCNQSKIEYSEKIFMSVGNKQYKDWCSWINLSMKVHQSSRQALFVCWLSIPYIAFQYNETANHNLLPNNFTIVNLLLFSFAATGCKCNSIGSTSSACDIVSGQCKCKQNVVGRQCDQCQVSIYLL